MLKIAKSILVAGGLIVATTASMPAFAGGLIGDAIEFGCGGCGVGRAADKVHDGFKRANPSYGKAEEKMTNDFREGVGLPRHCDPIFNKWGEQVGCQ